MNERTAEELATEDVPEWTEQPAAVDPADEVAALERRRTIERWASWIVVAGCAALVFAALQPHLILAGTIPTGGDMGAHVWGPRFLADHLLPDGRLTGWTQDWYAGFPAYVFYMVVPSLFIVWLSETLSGSFVPLVLVALAALATWVRFRVPGELGRRLGIAAAVLTVAAAASLLGAFLGAVPPKWVTSLLLLALAAAAVWTATRFGQRWARQLAWVGALFLVVLALPMPYNVAFKLVAVSGLVTLPVAVFALARAARVPFPGPPMVALASLFFIFDRSFTILGGNGASTMAGEFAFSISLTFAFLFLAVAFRGIRTGRDRALGAVLLALTILCHLIPAIFAGIAALVLLVVRREDRTPWWDRSTAGRVVAAVIVLVTLVTLVPDIDLPFGPTVGSPLPQWWFPALGTAAALVLFTGFEPRLVRWWTTKPGLVVGAALLVGLAALLVTRSTWWTVTVIAVVLVIAFFSGWDDRLARWLIVAAPTGIVVTAFWSVPFLSNSTYMNDMGWEKYTRYKDYLISDPSLDTGGMPYRNVVFALAGLGILLAVIHRVRLGWFLTLVVVAFSWIFRFFPQYRLWNARLLPFHYLAIYLLAGLAVALTLRSLAILVGDLLRSRREPVAVGVAGLSAASVVVLVVMLASFSFLPFGRTVPDPDGSGRTLFSWAGLEFQTGIVPDWARWNFEGLERKDAWPELEGVVAMMEGVGDEHGCGRAMWEYESELNRFGTPMALMLLPYFTDGCIGSMEGLYFEASSTTPFHFLNQSALSQAPSRAQRDLPYTPFDIDLGVQQLQMLGVRYYMATTDASIAAARNHDQLTELAAESFTSAPDAEGVSQQNWVVFEVADSELVTGLENDPVVLTDADDHIDGWVYAAEHPTVPEGEVRPPKSPGPAVKWFQDPARWDTHLATSGPDSWPRADADEVDPPRNPNPAVTVSQVETTNDSISFEVDRVGVPVLVRTSYFPNWKADGADGPYRVSPNFMVVVPTQQQVTLGYGYTAPDVLGWALTLAGLAGVVGLAVWDWRARRRVGDDDSEDDAATNRAADEDPHDRAHDAMPDGPVPDGSVPSSA